MTEIVVAQRMWQRRGTTAEWAAANPVLAQGEIGVETFAAGVPVKMKIGDGVTVWSLLSYSGGGGGGITPAMRFTAETSSAADVDPGVGKLAWNHATQASATMLFLDDTTADGAPITGMWPIIEQGGFIYIQNRLDESRWQIWRITSIVDASGYVKLGVVLVAYLGVLADGDPVLVTIENGPGPSTGTQPITGLSDTYIGSGNGSPEGVVTAPRGAVYTRLDGGPQTTLYMKESGVGNTGWVAYHRSTPSRSLAPFVSHDLTAADVAYRLNCDTVRVIHLPPTSGVFVLDDAVEIRQTTIHDVTFTPGVGVTIEYDASLFSAKSRYKGAVVEVKVVDTDTYSITGALADP